MDKRYFYEYTTPISMCVGQKIKSTVVGWLAFVRIVELRRRNTTIDDRKPASSPIFHDAQDRDRGHLRQSGTSTSDGLWQTRAAGQDHGHSGSVKGPDQACVGPAQQRVR